LIQIIPQTFFFILTFLPIAGTSAALVASLIVVAGHYYNWLTTDWVAINALSICFTLRILALTFHGLLFQLTKKAANKRRVINVDCSGPKDNCRIIAVSLI